MECFNKKVKCEFCNTEFNNTYLSKHLKRCPIEKMHLNDNKIINIIHNNIHNENHNNENHDNENHNDNIMFNRNICKTHLLINKLQLFRLYDNEKQIHIITRSPEQYSNTALFGKEIEDADLCTEGALRISVEEGLDDKTKQDFQNCCVVFDDMLESNQKLLDPFFTRGRHNNLDV